MPRRPSRKSTRHSSLSSSHHPGEAKQTEASRRAAVAGRQVVQQALVGTARGASIALGGPPARLEQRIDCGWLRKGRAHRRPSQPDPDLNNGAQFRDLCMLWELGTDLELRADSHETRPKTVPGYAPLDEGPGRLSGYSNYQQ